MSEPGPLSPAVKPPLGGEGEPRFGCSKPVIVGCGGVVALLVVVSMAVLFNAPRIFRWGLSKTQAVIHEALPEDLPAEERERLDEAFRGLIDAATDGVLSPDGVDQLQRVLTGALKKAQAGGLSRDDVRELTLGLEGVGGAETGNGADRGEGRGLRAVPDAVDVGRQALLATPAVGAA